MKQILELEQLLLGQDFSYSSATEIIDRYKQIAQTYAVVENAIAVLSDLKANKSYIFNGGFASAIDCKTDQSSTTIESIWEEDIYNLLHPDDAAERHLQEIRFFHLLRKKTISERTNYRTINLMRIKDRTGKYIPLLHRTFYLSSQENGSLWLALCLYNHAPIEQPSLTRFRGFIQNTATGEIITYAPEDSLIILSKREKEVLNLIEQGYLSKEIASKLNISKNTVDRHRQNIMERLRVKNSIEAIRIANSLHLL